MMTTGLIPSPASAPSPARATSTRAPAAGQISDLNLAARQRMLSQRMVMQTLLAANGDARQLDAARSTFQLFCDSHARLLGTINNYDALQRTALESTVDSTDGVLEALNATTTAFDVVTKAKADLLFKELTGIVSDIHTIAHEAKVVSFNAQVMAARAGQQGREFAVVANVLSGISTEIDGLSRKAIDLADRTPGTGMVMPAVRRDFATSRAP